MTGIVCDNCQTVETDRDEIDLRWLVVGFRDGTKFDACSPKCVRALLKSEVAPTLLRMDKAVAADA